jgi:rRNA maturation protein Rpf1
LITTSRYASLETRRYAKVLAKEELFISRGKRTVTQLVKIARKRGEHKILIVEEENKKPSKILTIEVSETEEWKWSDEIPVSDGI